MSQAANASSLWVRHDGPGSSRERLRKAVTALTRARRLQLLVDHAFAGLLVGLCLATVAVLVARQLPLPYLPWQLGCTAVIAAVAVAFVVGWRRRPDALDVAIRADVMLRLKQRLSTAWEFMVLGNDSELADRLAVHALRAGLPARPGTVFPLRVNRWGWLAPLAATALLLASIVDLSPLQTPAAHTLDEQVMVEGQRLSAFGREMQARAQRDKLPRSTRQAAQLERLGARMESGALSRSQALGQLDRMGESLDQERMQAQAEAKRSGVRRAQNPQGSRAASDLDSGAMLERMQRGALDRDDTRALAQRMDDLERAGIPRQEMQNALDRRQAGDDDALRDILEKLARFERALKEDKQLQEALEQVRRARENLGTPSATSDREGRPSAAIEWDEDERETRSARGEADPRAEARFDGQGTGRSRAAAAQGDSSVATERAGSPSQPEPDSSGRVLRPQGQVREGAEYTSQGQMLPRSNRPSVPSTEMSAEFAAQVEAVQSRENYPAHQKDFIRRYFLNLSQGAPDRREQPAARGAP